MMLANMSMSTEKAVVTSGCYAGHEGLQAAVGQDVVLCSLSAGQSKAGI